MSYHQLLTSLLSPNHTEGGKWLRIPKMVHNLYLKLTRRSQIGYIPEVKIRVLMITGVYYPEINGAVLQCMQLIRSVGESISFSVLASTNNKSSAGSDYVDGLLVTKVLTSGRSKLEYIVRSMYFFICLIGVLQKVDIVHIHGFSKRNAIAIVIGRILRKRVILKMTSFGVDDPMSVKRSSVLSWQVIKYCHAYIGISPAFYASYQESGMIDTKYNLIPNCVDSRRFCPIPITEKNILKHKYGFHKTDSIILFVGHFSPEKRPMLAYETWLLLHKRSPHVKLILIGHTKKLYEVDDKIIEAIRHDAFNRGVLSSIHFVESTLHVDEYMKMANVFVLPSTREGLPNVLLEAMACALPCFVTYLPGITDWLIDDKNTGILIQSSLPLIWAETMLPYITSYSQQMDIGYNARRFVENRFSCESSASSVRVLYEALYANHSNYPQ